MKNFNIKAGKSNASIRLVADSGSTKTDWAYLPTSTLEQGGDQCCAACLSEKLVHISTQGINPVVQDEATILGILHDELLVQLEGIVPSEIYFYGAGCNPQAAPQMKAFLLQIFPDAQITVESDLLGAARSVCGHGPGIACILGTGSNSCLYDGENIVSNIPPLGYILGDEGSGAVLGKRFLNRIYKDEQWSDLRKYFERQTGLSYNDVISRVYRQPMANRFLASLAPIIKQCLSQNDAPGESVALVESVVLENFRAFFENNVKAYQSQRVVNFVGGIAYNFSRQLQQVTHEFGYAVGRICKSPIDGLYAYHMDLGLNREEVF